MKRRWVQGMLLAGMLILTGCGAKNSSPVENGKDYTWNDITVMLPEDWADRCTIKEDENGFTIYQTASYEKMEGLGYLCSFEKSDAWMNYGAGENLIAYTEDGTLYYLMQILQARAPASIRLCTLLDKPERRTKPITADYCGFSIPDAFVVGYGLDYAEKYRNLPYIGILKPEVYGG